MKHTLIRLSLISIMTISTVSAFGWGQKGHDVTCAIAQRHLSKKAKKQIASILDGRSIIYWANWMDNASHTPQYEYTKTWHYRNVDAEQTYESMPEEPSGDVVTAIQTQTELLKNSQASKEAAALALKFLVHLVGDVHCPMHMGHKSDLGGNKWQIQYFNKGTNLHSIWDTDIIEGTHKWTYTEWADQLDIIDKKTIIQLTQGTEKDWAKGTLSIAQKIYDTTPVGSKLSYDYSSEWTPVIEQQLLLGGLRLARLLNEIFR